MSTISLYFARHTLMTKPRNRLFMQFIIYQTQKLVGREFGVLFELYIVLFELYGLKHLSQYVRDCRDMRN